MSELVPFDKDPRFPALWARLCAIWTDKEATLWLITEQRLLGGERPSSRLARGDFDSVVALVDQLESGAFV